MAKKVDNDELVTFVPGSSVIDIAEIRRAQEQNEMDLSSELDQEDSELSLDDQAKLIMEELENDSELKNDVLKDYEESESDADLAKIADSVATQTAEDIARFQELASEVSDELRAENINMIKEDILLESTIAQELAAENKSENKKKSKKQKAKTQQDSLNASAETKSETTSAESDSEDSEIESEEMSEQDLALKAALPQIGENGEYDQNDLQSCISALLFYSEKPLSLKKMKEMLEMPDAEDELFLNAIAFLKEEFSKLSHGFEIAEIAGGYQYRTKINRAPLLRKLAKVQIQRLSRGAMETLTIVAFKQPCTKDDIDQVRGVDSSHFIRTLLDRNLIEVTGRSEAAGRPMIYGTTNTFLEVFGMMDLTTLPSLSEIEAMVPQLAAQEEGQEDPRIIQMRKMVSQMKTEANHLDYSGKEDEVILQEIRDRVKSIDVTTPYLSRQKELAEQGIQGLEAEEILNREFGFSRDLEAKTDTLEEQKPLFEGDVNLGLDLNEIELAASEAAKMNQVREALDQIDLVDE
jgi:segregation and condensation protein B